MTSFLLRKVCFYDRSSSVSLELNSSALFLEIKRGDALITRMDFPYSKSGVVFARRVYNGMQ